MKKRLNGSFESRFWKKVNKTPECWKWTATISRKGYGMIGCGKKEHGNIGAHQGSWIIAYGAIPSGMDVAHKCNNKSCVRPDHLYLATRKQNILDAVRDGLIVPPKTVRGEGHPSSKITDDDVRRIRAAPTGEVAAVARSIGIGYSEASLIKRRIRWGHVE